MSTLCLNMIVKNESKIILRALESVKKYIDYWVICDTGSTDNTKEIITNYFKENNIQGELYDIPWKNFCVTRNESLQKARGKKDYILLMDADMIFKARNEDFKEKLKQDVYIILQGTGFVYYNVRIVKSTIMCEYKGVTHEYLSYNSTQVKEKFDDVYFEDYGDGGNRTEKFTRDIKLLKEGINDEPNNDRYYFYLAQSYKDTQDFENAIIWYKKRISMGGWVEEVWYSYYMIGKCFKELKNYSMAIQYYLEAYNFHSKRAEPLYDIIYHYRNNEKYNIAYMFLKNALKIDFPSNDTLFIDESIYKYKLLYELSIISFYVNDMNGYLASDTLKISKNLGVPNFIVNSATDNIFFYVQKLSDLVKGNVEIKELQLNITGNNNHICNPSIITVDNGYILNIREVNYTFDIPNNRYIYDGVVITTNHLVKLNSFNNINEIKDNDNTITLKDNIIHTYQSEVMGFEDMRLVYFNGFIYGLTSRMTQTSCLNEMVLCRINSNNEIDTVLRLKGYADDQCQKNWLPFVHNNKLLLLYSSDPVVILEPDMSTGICSYIKNTDQVVNQFNGTLFRGGSQLLKYKDGFLYIIHEVIFKSNRRYYFNRFVYLDNHFNIKELSPLFYFMDKTIEFVSGMAYDLNNQNVLITFGYEDKNKACIGRISIIDIESILNLSIKMKFLNHFL